MNRFLIAIKRCTFQVVCERFTCTGVHSINMGLAVRSYKWIILMENKITWSLPASSWKINHTCITCETRRQSSHSISLSETSMISVLFSTNVPVCTEATEKPSGCWEVRVMLLELCLRQTSSQNHKWFIVFWEAGSNTDLKYQNLSHKDEF